MNNMDYKKLDWKFDREPFTERNYFYAEKDGHSIIVKHIWDFPSVGGAFPLPTDDYRVVIDGVTVKHYDAKDVYESLEREYDGIERAHQQKLKQFSEEIFGD